MSPAAAPRPGVGAPPPPVTSRPSFAAPHPASPQPPAGAPLRPAVAHAPVAAPHVAPAAAAPVAPTPASPTPTPVTSATPATGAPAARAPINPFLANDPNAKAKRLARALVSDICAYFPQKREEGIRDGTLKQLFREEIKKSYEEYVDQIGREFAESTTHFQDALNDVLAGGKKLF
jgi:hypothetical protein